MSKYTLPELGYDTSALEPHISGKVMELHHGKHHAAYVKNANAAIEKLDEARAGSDFTRLAALEKALAFNLSGHVLHSIFWRNLSPQGGGHPMGSSPRPSTATLAPSTSSARSSPRSPRRSWVRDGRRWSGSRSGNAF